jgi:hypothetical protein
MPPDAAIAPQGRIRRALAAFGAPSPWIAAALALHLGFVVVRFPGGAVHKRLRTIAEQREHGDLWHFRHQDEPTRRLVAWLLAEVPRDQAVLFEGSTRGVIEALSSAVFPATLVRSSALRPDGTAGGRPVFRGRPPWLPAAAPDAPPGAVVCRAGALHWRTR